jgi:hypothetical protein
MKKIFAMLVLFIAIMQLVAFDKYAGEIYDLPTGVRNIAMGNTGLTDINTYSPAYWNAALMPLINKSRVEIMHADEFDGLFTYDNISSHWASDNGVSFSLTRISVNDIPLTTLEDETLEISNDNRPYAYKHVDNNDILLSLGLSRKLRENLYLDLTPKLTYRNLAEENAWAIGGDISLLFQPYQSLLLATKIHNVVSTHVLWENGEYETVSPKTDIEGRYLFSLFNDSIPMELAYRCEMFMFDDSPIGQTDIGFTSINNHLGLSITPYQNISLLTGYDVDSITAGVDLKISDFSIFYSYRMNDNSDLGNSQKIAIGYNF